MSVENLSKVLRPQSVAVIGASSKEGSVGQTVLKNLIDSEFPGDIFPVNPKHDSLLGLKNYRSVEELPRAVDLAIVATPATTVPQIVSSCGEKGILGLIVLSAGFREVGEQGRAIEAEVQRELDRFPGMRLVGPNCLGILAPHSKLNASFANDMPAEGRIAFISQSGALCTSILDWSLAEKIGFSYFISIGNAMNVKVGDLIDFMANDPHTDSIVLYVESVTEARRFMSAARAFARTKPIVVYKAGRFSQSAQAAASHTGAMAGEDDVYEAAFKRAGMVRVYDASDMFDCAELLARQHRPKGPRLAIITNAGGPGVMALDELLQRQGTLAELEPSTIEQLDNFLPPHWSHNNPVDILGDALPERFQQAVETVAADQQVDALLVTLTPQAMTDPTETAHCVAKAAKKTNKPVLAVWMGGPAVEPGREILNQAGIATYDSPDRAVRAFTYLVSFNQMREVLYETPRHLPNPSPQDENSARTKLQQYVAQQRSALTESESKAILQQYGIPTTVPVPADSAEQAVSIARQLSYPVVMKIHSPDILHKTEVRGVVTGISDDEAVRRTFEEMTERAKELRPDADIQGVTIQRMVSSAEGIELIVGAKRDPVFGALIMLGAGGITAELLRDRALELPPLNERLARRMIDSLKIRQLLHGYRGRSPIDLDQLTEVLVRTSKLIADNPEILELDINPLLATPEGMMALDGRVILDSHTSAEGRKQFSHLAICPYPEQYVRQATLQDGTQVTLRPIQPEDEPLWHELLGRCSERSIWLRFRYLFKETTHEMATRFCFIDYDRTMAIVAELEQQGETQLLGVGRLLADVDHNNAEYAVLVDDAWQGRGLGTLLTEYCLNICHDWGIEHVKVETTADNQRMQHIAKRFEFQRADSGDQQELVFQKQLQATAETELLLSQ